MWLAGAGKETGGQFAVQLGFQVASVTLGEFLGHGGRNSHAFGDGNTSLTSRSMLDNGTSRAEQIDDSSSDDASFWPRSTSLR